MRDRIDRRWVLAGLLALSACGWNLTPYRYAFTTTDEAREAFFAAIRAFAEQEGMKLTEQQTEAAPDPIRHMFLLGGWRCHITITSDFQNGVAAANRFNAFIASTQDSTPWALRGQALETFAARFESALASVPGVEVERLAPPTGFFEN